MSSVSFLLHISSQYTLHNNATPLLHHPPRRNRMVPKRPTHGPNRPPPNIERRKAHQSNRQSPSRRRQTSRTEKDKPCVSPAEPPNQTTLTTQFRLTPLSCAANPRTPRNRLPRTPTLERAAQTRVRRSHPHRSQGRGYGGYPGMGLR